VAIPIRTVLARLTSNERTVHFASGASDLRG